ncbi:MAG: hypothetical protein IJ760_01565 [Bacteroidales bacterium]|nr:hypothetical protein [Bacteroidales bacterium]
MRNTGWSFFFALLLGDVVALVMLKLGVELNTVIVVAGLVFALLALVLALGARRSNRIKRREQEAMAKIAELEEKVNGTATEDGAAK